MFVTRGFPLLAETVGVAQYPVSFSAHCVEMAILFKKNLQVVSRKIIHLCRQYYEKNTKGRITKNPFLEGLFY